MRRENQSNRQGYIPLFLRRIQNDPDFLKEKSVSRLEAKIDLLIHATFIPTHSVSTGANSSITLRKGQAFVAKKELARRWGWSREKVKRFFEALSAQRGEPWAIEEASVYSTTGPATLGTLVTFINFERLISE